MNFDKVRQERRLYSVWSVLGRSPTRGRMICPLPFHAHKNYTGSFAVLSSGEHGERWRCFGSCNLEGDVIDLIGYLRIPGYDPHDIKLVEKAWSLLDGNYEIQEIPPKPKKVTLAPDAWKLPLTDTIIEYAKARGLNSLTLEKFRVGEFLNRGQTFMSMPVFEEGELVCIKYRCVTEKIFFTAKGSRSAMLNFDAVNYTDEPVLILKGEIPVYLCDQLGFLACGFTGGEGYTGGMYFPNLSFSKKRIVVGDNDEAGREGAKKRADALHAEMRFPPPPYKDIDEWILHDTDAIHIIEGWLE